MDVNIKRYNNNLNYIFFKLLERYKIVLIKGYRYDLR